MQMPDMQEKYFEKLNETLKFDIDELIKTPIVQTEKSNIENIIATRNLGKIRFY